MSSTSYSLQNSRSGFGSVASTRQSNPRSRRVTARPIAPSPTIPTVEQARSRVGPRPRHSPERTIASSSGSRRMQASISASAISATASALTAGVVMTATPASVAAGMSIASEPVPQRRIAFRSGSASSTARVYGSLPATTAQAPSRPRRSTSSSRAEDRS